MSFTVLASKFTSETGAPVESAVLTRDEYEQLLMDIESIKTEAREQALAGVRRITMADTPVIEQLNARFGVIYRYYEKALKDSDLEYGEDERFTKLPSYSLVFNDLYDSANNELIITLNILEDTIAIDHTHDQIGVFGDKSELPLHWFDPEADKGTPVWEAEIKNHIKSVKAEKARKEAAREAERKKQEERERETYRRLHKKYGHENT